jgi:hypothetical protein
MTPRANPTFYPIIILLLVALVIFSPALPKLEPLDRVLKILPKTATVSKPDVKVWVNQRSGFYYCEDSALYGKTQPGAFMTQGEAWQTGYRPFAKKPCQ